MENLLLGVRFRKTWRSHQELGEEPGFKQDRSAALSRPVHGDRKRTEQSTSTLSLRERLTRRSCGGLPRKDVAIAEKLNDDQLRLSSGHVPTATVGFDANHKTQNHRTSGFLQLFFSSSGSQDDPQHAQLFASSSQSRQSLGPGSHEPCPRRPIASQESSETAGCADAAGYSPRHRSPTGTDKIDCHVDRRWFLADRRGCRATLGKNSPGSHRSLRAIL